MSKIVWLITRDHRIDDNYVLRAAIEETKKLKGTLYPIFRFDDRQINKNKNEYYSEKAVTFMIESLEILSKEIPITFVHYKDDDDFGKFLEKFDKLFITYDFTPFARERVENLSEYIEIEEVEDVLLIPDLDKLPSASKLQPFITSYTRNEIPKPFTINKQDLKLMEKLKDTISPKKFLPSTKSPNMRVRPSELDKIVKNVNKNISGYDAKRKLIGNPSVSYLSAFIKFGLISVRQVYHMVKGSEKDIESFRRELMFRDFFYSFAYHEPDSVYKEPNYEESDLGIPRFINKEDLKEWRGTTKSDEKDIKEAKEIYENWENAKTEYELVNAGIRELNETGYMLNRLRMITTSYLSRDNNIWWKYPEKYFAQHLTDYDWTINAINHMNIAKVGPYAKWTQDFNIETQERENVSDKEKYYNQF